MKLTARLFYLSLALATGALASGFGLGPATPLSLALGLAWWYGWLRGWGWAASLALPAFVLAAVAGYWLAGAPAGLMLVSIVAALLAWDLDHFAQRARSVDRVEAAAAIERSHLRRLAATNGVGLLLAGAALAIRLRFGFGVALLLALLAAWALSQVIGFMRRESDGGG